MRRVAPFLLPILFSMLLFAAPAEIESPRSQLWMIFKIFFQIAVAAVLMVLAVRWYKKNKP